MVAPTTNQDKTKVVAVKATKRLVKKAPKPAATAVKATKAVAKTPVATAKAVKVAKVPKTPKVAVEAKAVSVRKVNNKPVLAKTTGINISPAKVKNIVSNHVLNRRSQPVLTELKNARPHTTKKTVDGKEVEHKVAGTPVANLSQETRDFLVHATAEYEKNMKEEFAKHKVSKMPTDAREAYVTARTAAKALHDKAHAEGFLNTDGSTFDVNVFNVKYDSGFYAEYNKEAAKRAAEETDEWKAAIDRVSKLKCRFSTNSRVFLSAFVEYLIKQLALNGTVCCIADKKKIIQLSHVLDTSKEGFAERFPLYPLIVNLDTFKQAQAHLAADRSNSTTVEPEVADDEGEDDAQSVKKSRSTDLFTLNGVSLDTQYQFRYYISESCRETRMDLASTEKDADGNLMDIYNHTSVSKVFKNFCSTLVCEFLTRIGKMLEKEIETRGIKTVNDTIINAVISHYHIVCGVDDEPTLNFIRTVATKYYSYVSDRQQKRRDGLPATTGDVPYTKEKV